MNPQKQELLTKLKAANNILVTVSSNPSVDQLAACIGLTLLLNKLKKHATAVFSGAVPSTIEFLKPEETIEKNTDSLRDFIISLDKSKADKLRYKVEDQVVRIFITPFRTSITEGDLDFSQGDFNVDIVLCLGVQNQQELDQAITMHGRILHDAVLMGIGTHEASELGTINWTEPGASSLSELVSSLADDLGKDLVDGQIATALLTGIVAETERFSNEKTSPETMRLSAELMAAGANQQLVANKLDGSQSFTSDTASVGSAQAPGQDGTLEIAHNAGATDSLELPAPDESATAELQEDEESPLLSNDGVTPPEETGFSLSPASRMVLQPPSLGGTLTANSMPQLESLQDPLNPATPTSADPMTNQPILDHGVVGEPAAAEPAPELPNPAEPALAEPAQVVIPTPQGPVEPPVLPSPALVAAPPLNQDDSTPVDPLAQFSPAPLPPLPEPPTTPSASPDPAVAPIPAPPIDTAGGTLTDLEASVNSPHLEPTAAPTDTLPQDLDAARDAVMAAINSAPPVGPPEPTAASGASGYLNVQDLPGISDEVPLMPSTPDLTEAAANGTAALPSVEPLPMAQPPAGPGPASSTSVVSPDSPPPVPPPLPLDNLTQFTAPDNNPTS